MKKILGILFVAFALFPSARAQIAGVVLDASDGESVPFANVQYKGNHVGTSCDVDGRYSIARHNGWRLTFSAVGYESQVINVTGNTPAKLTIRLKPATEKLSEVVIKQKRSSKYSRKNNPAVELMRKVIAAKKKADLRQHDYYQYNHYQKMTLALNDITPDQLQGAFFKKHSWLKNQVEHCQYNDKLILPISVEENLIKKLYRKEPRSERSIIEGQTSTGVNDLFQTGDIINTAMKDIFTDVDIYDNHVRLFQYPFTSPIGDDAIAFYRYYITDTLYVGTDRCIRLDFTPNNAQDFGFRGQLYVIADSLDQYQVKRCELQIPATSDVNWVENMQCMQEFNKLDTGEWVLTVDDMIVELKVTNFIQKAIVIRTTRRTDWAFEDIPKRMFRGRKSTVKDSYAEMRSDDYWSKYRQVELTKSENSMESFVHRIEQIKGFKYIIFGLRGLIENFVETGSKDHPSKVDVGPVNTIISQNFYDKWRLRASGQTTANLDPHWFFKGYVARGMCSHQNYYDAEVIYSFNKKEYLPREFPKQTLTFSSTRDVALPSDKFIQTDKDNMFTSFKVHEIDKMFLYNRQELNFEYEQEWGFKMFASTKTEKVEPIGKTELIPLATGNHLSSIRYTEGTVGLRYAPGETFVNTKQHRWPINLDAPVFRLQHTVGFKGFLGGEYNYNFTEAEFYKRIWMPYNWGKIDTRVKAGVQWNQVPYPLLIMPVANLSYILEDQTFNLINNMEFLNDRYCSVEMSWDMNGKLFNRIPLLRRLKWREWIGVKMLWGGLSDKNNPYLPQNAGSTVLMEFPEGCNVMDGRRPYWEVMVGVHNIFKLLHIEYVRRLSYLNLPTTMKDGFRFTIRTTF